MGDREGSRRGGVSVLLSVFCDDPFYDGICRDEQMGQEPPHPRAGQYWRP